MSTNPFRCLDKRQLRIVYAGKQFLVLINVLARQTNPMHRVFIILLFLGLLIFHAESKLSPLFYRHPKELEPTSNSDLTRSYSESENLSIIELLHPLEFKNRRLRIIRNMTSGGSIFIANYLFQPDEAGYEMSAELISAAKRGIQVWLLIDGMDYGPHVPSPRDFYRFLANAGIYIKIFHSMRGLNFIGQILTGDFKTRLHSKIFIANDQMILGSCNYYNFSLNLYGIENDVHITGPLVRQGKEDFIRLWTSSENTLIRKSLVVKATEAVPEAQQGPVLVKNPAADPDDFVAKYQTAVIPPIRKGFVAAVSDVKYVYDLPVRPKPNWQYEEVWNWNTFENTIHRLSEEEGFKKALQYPGTFGEILRLLVSAENSVDIVTPYFDLIPPLEMAFKYLLQKGIKIRVITGSYELMKSEFAPLAHCYQRNLKRYSHWNPPFELWETQYDNQLHSKFIVVDGDRYGDEEFSKKSSFYFGSFNFSQASPLYSLENGIIGSEKRWLPGSSAFTFSKLLNMQFEEFLQHSRPIINQFNLKNNDDVCGPLHRCSSDFNFPLFCRFI